VFGRRVLVEIDMVIKLRKRMDVARLLIKTNVPSSCNSNVHMKINGIIYDIRIVEEVFGKTNCCVPK
jgi:hypothetical protein